MRLSFLPTLTTSLNINRQTSRLLSSSTRTQAAVKLAYEKYPPTKPPTRTKAPLLILPGLFGSKQNWRGISKALCNKSERDIWALDLRNHGTSPHDGVMTYEAMAKDVAAFVDEQRLEQFHLLGHSMGGKVAMTLALSPTLSTKLSNLIIEDIAPVSGSVSTEFRDYVRIMMSVESMSLGSRKEADEAMREVVPDQSIRAFLLTNLLPITSSFPHARFRVPLDIISISLNELGDFQSESEGAQWKGKTLFLKGLQSNYINKRNESSLRTFFPNMELETIETGHWLHAEKPQEFSDVLLRFLDD